MYLYKYTDNKLISDLPVLLIGGIGLLIAGFLLIKSGENDSVSCGMIIDGNPERQI